MMRGLRYILLSGSLGVLMLALAACSSIGSVTATPPKAAVATNQTTSASAAPTVATPVSSPTRPATAATPSATATAGASPTTASASPARVATPGTPATPAGTRVAPEQAYKNLQQLPNSRQTWSFTGVALVGFSGTLSPVFDYADGNAKVTLTGGGATIEAYKVNGQIYTRAPILGVVPADPSNPLAPTADNLFALPDQILKILIPGGGQYTLAGPDTVNGRAATKYTSTIAVPDLGLLNPALSGQQGSAVTTVWVDDAQGYIAALDATITATTSGTTATPIKIHLDVTDVGQVPAITVPH